VNPVLAALDNPALRAATLLLTLSLVACSSVDVSGDKVDYRSKAVKSSSLEVPPDLTQLTRDGRYQPRSGVVSAAGLKQGAEAGSPARAAAAAALVAPAAVGDLRIERQGDSRWLVSKLPPETLYPLLRSFWLENGFVLEVDNAQIGVMETGWAENRAKLPLDFLRNAVGKVFDNLYSTGERDRYRTRIERTAGGSEIFISHRGLTEVYADQRRESTIWQARPTDPELEAEFLTRFMVKLGVPQDSARTTVANAPPATAQARTATVASTAAMEIDESFDRAWRQVGLALDRSGFTVEDRDRSAGLYFVRYIDPKTVGQEAPNFFMKFFSSESATIGTQRFRVLIKAAGAKSLVSVQNSAGAADDSEAARRIIGRLIDELK
jgi:outer membrane protein assembly factor BamC